MEQATVRQPNTGKNIFPSRTFHLYVESFIFIASFITALHEAVGKYLIYREALKLVDSSRVLFLAMPADIYDAFGDEPLVKAVFTKHEFKIILYEPDTEKIKSWIK